MWSVEKHGEMNKQMVCIHVTLHLMASVQPPSSLRPASVQLPSCSSEAESDADWLDMARACGELRRPASPWVALSIRGQSGGQAPRCAEEKDPRGRCHPAQLPLPVIPPSSTTPLHPPPNSKPRFEGGAGLPEQRTLSSADRSFSIFTIMIWKSLLLDMQDIQPAVWFMEFTLTSNVAQNMAVCRLWALIRDGHDHSEDRFIFTVTSGTINTNRDVVCTKIILINLQTTSRSNRDAASLKKFMWS